MFYRPITIYKVDQTSQEESVHTVTHARVNKGSLSTSSSYLQADAILSKNVKTFEVRYSPKIKEIENEYELFRIDYQGTKYQVVDYDDFQDTHINVRLLAQAIE